LKLRRLEIRSMPGIDRAFTLDEMSDGLNVIWGPNGVGKSRICAATRALLWGEHGIAENALDANADFEHEGSPWQVMRQGSRHVWQRGGIEADPPGLPAEHLDGCFFLGLRDLLDDSAGAGGAVAREIRKQMSGGFDLEAIVSEFRAAVPPRIGRTESNAVRDAVKAIHRADREQGEAAAHEAELGTLESRAADAESARSRLRHYEAAIDLRVLKDEMEAFLAERAEMPDALGAMDGRELDRLESVEADLVRKESDQDSARSRLEEAERTARQTGLEEAIDPAVLSTWRERAEALVALEQNRDGVRVEERVAFAKLAERREALGARVPTEGASNVPDDASAQGHLALGVEDEFDLFQFLGESQQWVLEKKAAEEQLHLLAAHPFSEDEARRLDLARRALGPSRAWLRSSAYDASTSAGATPGPAPGRLIMIGSALAAIGAGAFWMDSAFAVGVGWAALVVMGMGFGVAGLGLLRGSHGAQDAAQPDPRALARRDWPVGIDGPDSWTVEAVIEYLRALEEEVASLEARKKRTEIREVESDRIEQKLKGLAKRTTDLEAKRRQLADRFGLEGLRSDVELVDLVRRLEAAHDAHTEHRGIVIRAEALDERWRAAVAALAEFLTGFGEAAPEDAHAARAGIHSLEERSRGVSDARGAAARERLSLERLAGEIDALEAARGDIFSGAGVDPSDRAGLARRVDALPRFRKLETSIAELVRGIGRNASRLEEVGEGALAAFDLNRLERERAALGRESDEGDEIRRQIVGIEQKVAALREGDSLESALADEQAALQAMHDRREQALLALAGATLIEGVRADHESDQMPRVLGRARDLFARFTHDGYRLEVAERDAGSFVAVDTRTGKGLRPDQLSDGTRAQLILAARLAFAEEVEQGSDLPLFLDEAMDHSDPERFHAIARSLARMVSDEGRQIFYLTNEPNDFEQFRRAFAEEGCAPPVTLDLARVRGEVEAPGRSEGLRVPPLPVVPAPAEGGDATDYGAVLGVPVLDPDRRADDQHLFHLLRDDLGLLYEFLVARIESVGQCRNQLDSGSDFARSLAERGEVGAGLGSRIDLLETFCEAWREGRGRRLERRALEASEAISDRYIDDLAEIAAELDGDAEALLRTIEDRGDARLRGFRKDSAANLKQYLRDEGYVDARSTLGESEMIDRTLATPAAHRLSAKLAAELVHQWWTLCQTRSLSG